MKITHLHKLIFTFSFIFVVVSCNNNSNKNKEPDRTSDPAYIDSINAVRKAERLQQKIEEDKRNGRFRAIDTVYYGDICILIDSVAIKKANLDNNSSRQMSDRIMGGAFRSYDIYMTITNTSEDQTLPLPYVFPGKTKEEERIAANSSGTMFMLGTRMFINTKTNKIQNDDILPGKSISGYYHVMSRGAKFIYMSYGDSDSEFRDEEESDIPAGYEDKEVFIDLSSKMSTPSE